MYLLLNFKILHDIGGAEYVQRPLAKAKLVLNDIKLKLIVTKTI